MAVRSSMLQLITRTRLLISDPAGASQQFADQDIQDTLDQSRDDIRYEDLTIAPSIVNTASTSNIAVTIFADYYSAYSWWESDVELQGYLNGAYWKDLSGAVVSSDYITGHWTFESSVFTTGTAPGQLPPVFVTGKVYDLNAAAAELLELWAAALACAYDVVVDGQNLRRSQLMAAKLTMAQHYRRLSKPKRMKMMRTDVQPPMSASRVRLLDSDDSMKGY